MAVLAGPTEDTFPFPFQLRSFYCCANWPRRVVAGMPQQLFSLQLPPLREETVSPVLQIGRESASSNRKGNFADGEGFPSFAVMVRRQEND